MLRLKLGSEFVLFGSLYAVKAISRKSVVFSLCESKQNSAKELELSLKEVELQIL